MAKPKVTQTTPVAPQVVEAFQIQPIGEPLRPTAFGVKCECGQTVFMVTGLALNVEIPEGMDIKAVCRCKREYSIIEQQVAVAEARKQMEAQQAQA